MKVLKFGGTSVGTVSSLRNVKYIVESFNEPVIVVVSALGGLTDNLIATAKLAVAGEDFTSNFEGIVKRHHDIINEIVPPQKRSDLIPVINALLDELGNIYKGVSLIRDLSPRTIDIIVSYGERMSSAIIARIIENAKLYDSRYFIKTLNRFGKNMLDVELTKKLVEATFRDSIPSVAVAPGFISTDANGDITNLGRGGSDYTAAILAAVLNADELQIWTDVDGFMTADPRKISSAKVIDRLTFIEAMELCNFGAKVIYPPTIYPVFHKNIPIVIKNTFNYNAPGTIIDEGDSKATLEERSQIRGVTSLSDMWLISISGDTIKSQEDNSRIYNALSRQEVSFFPMSSTIKENAISFAVKQVDIENAKNAIATEFITELQTGEIKPLNVESGLSTIALVGDNLNSSSEVLSHLCTYLRKDGVEIKSIAQGGTQNTLSFLVNANDERKALEIAHKLIEESCM